MRPPSYYTSIALGNERNRSSSYLGDSSGSITYRTPSQQLRSSLASSSSSSYVNRSHLPYVAQSTLVAHCFTGAGSSTRPYGSNSSASSGYLSSRTASTSSSSTISGGYLSSSRPVSRRSPSAYGSVSNPSASSSYLPPRSAYLSSSTSSPSSATLSSSSRYRSTTGTSLSSYYKPIRLRERPLLTQISSRLATRTTLRDSEQRHSERSITASPVQPLIDGNVDKKLDKNEEEADWSHDVARNISRNKYLIKFREIDKPARKTTPIDDKLEADSPPKRPADDVGEICELKSAQVELEEANTIGIDSRSRAESEAAASVLMEPSDKARDKEQTSEMIVENENCDTSAKKRVKKIKKKASGIKNSRKLSASEEKLSSAEVDLVTSEQSMKEAEKQKKPEITSAESAKSQLETNNQKPNDISAAEAVATLETPPAPANKKRNVKLKLKPIGAKKQTAGPAAAEPSSKQQSGLIKERLETEKQKSLVQQESAVAVPKHPKMVKKLIRRPSDPKMNSNANENKDKLHKEKKASAQITDVAGTVQSDNKENVITRRKASDGKLKVDTKLASLSKGATKQIQTSPASNQSESTGTAKLSRIRFREYHYDDFNFLTVLGHGGWGFVILAELKEYDACFAVKCIKKITIVEDDDYDSIMIERKVLALGNVNPFICKLFCTFETDGYLFFVMEYCAGGDLMFHVQREGKFTESRSRFYAAEIICAIKFLHNRHIIYRDLKLDNILLDLRGHIRLVDFGMCQCRTYREEMLPSNFCGTPEYISPEIIKGVPYNHSVDWWSFGVLLYEMAVGKMPFRGNDENELLWNVCYEQIHYPMFLTKELTDLLKLLLEREPIKRMGMATCKAGDIYDQPFFRGVNWKAVEELRVEPPFVPEVTSKRDVQNFDTDFTESACELSPVDEKTLARIDQKQFQKFPYTNPDIFMFQQPTQ